MNTNIDTKPGFKIAGLSYKLEKREEAKKLIEEFIEKYKNKALDQYGAFYGLMEYNAIENAYNYFLGFELADEDLINELGFVTYELGESIYLEIDVEGDIEDAYKYTYEKFFPNKKYFHGLGPDVEFYQYDEENDEIGNINLYICLKENPNIKNEGLL